MPELPEVETVARDLRGLVLDGTLTGATVLWARTLRTHSPDSFGPAVRGRRIEAIGRRGKQLVVRLSGPLVLTVHLKMTGQLFVVPQGTLADAHVRLVLHLADGRDIRFRDIRKFGKIGLYEVDEGTGEPIGERGGAAVFARVGPEPLEDAFDIRTFRRLVRGRRGRLKPLLLDQSFVAGIGNIYADEALHAARLHPLRSVTTLRPPDERRLHGEIRRILAEAVSRRGSSVDDYTAPDGDGSMQDHLLVYQRAGQPCVRCSKPIRRIVVGGRATHFCSWCQRLPGSDAAGARDILRTMSPSRTGRSGTTSRPSSVRGPRWTELGGDGSLGRSDAERARSRAERTRRAAAGRRAAARASQIGR